jgi:hypothetical protein
MTLRDALVGGWMLQTFQTVDHDGSVREPLGPSPRGLILYTPDGCMSAQLAPGEGVSEIGDYIAYGGRFHVDEAAATVRHDVVMATIPDLLLTPQVRHARIDGDALTLSASMPDEQGSPTHSTLVWRRTT